MNSMLLKAAGPMVLVAHADPDERSWMTYLLVSSGYRVTSCDNGRDALRQIECEHFALVVTAVSMPQADGLELIRVLVERHHETCVIALAAPDPIEQIYLRSAAAIGATATYTMPIAPNVLLDAVREAIKA